MQTTVGQIHFEDFDGRTFERLVFAYLVRTRPELELNWTGEKGKDEGRDVWGVAKEPGDGTKTFCALCANYRRLTFRKIQEDLDKVLSGDEKPEEVLAVCGGGIGTAVRKRLEAYAEDKGVTRFALWSGADFEERLRRDTQELLRRFVGGERFPDKAVRLIDFARSAAAIPKYEVFLSYSRADEEAVKEVAEFLTHEVGLEVFLDHWNLVPGEPWQEAIEKALAEASSCAVFVGPGGIGTWEHEEMRVAIDRRVRDRTFRVIPVLLPGAQRGARGRLPSFLTRYTWVEFRKRLDEPRALRRLVAGIRGRPPGPEREEASTLDENPYRGLWPFEEEHARYFFGREASTDWLVSMLGTSRFLAVIGPSGSGKSSLVRAGLVPALRSGGLEGSDGWHYRVMKPGHRPTENLALVLAGLGGREVEPSSLGSQIEAIKTEARQLHLAVRVALGGAEANREAPEGRAGAAGSGSAGEAARVVLVVDQFEEVFTLCANEVERRAFIDNLLYASSIEGGRTVVILTLRADFYQRCADYPGLAARLTDCQMLVGPMEPDELARAIEEPARMGGVSVDEDLVEHLVGEVGAEPGSLPLLQDALYELYERKSGPRLTLAEYIQIGGIEGALARRADAVFTSLDKDRQEIAKALLLRLTSTLHQGEATRRPSAFAELVPFGEDSSAIEAIVQQLVVARLLTTYTAATSGHTDHEEGEERIVDVAHEALIRGWPKLKNWIELDRESLRIQQRLANAAEQWRTEDRDESLLDKGRRLREASVWAETHLNQLNAIEREFLFRSLVASGKDDLEAWVPRFGDEAEILALAATYLDSTGDARRRRGLLILRWSPASPGSDTDKSLLRAALADPSDTLRRLAVKSLCDRGALPWLISQLNEAPLKSDRRARLRSAVAVARNLPGFGRQIDEALRGRTKRRIVLHSAVRLVRDYLAEMAIVFTVSYFAMLVVRQIAGSMAHLVTNPIDPPMSTQTILITLIVGLYELLRAAIEGRRVTPRDCRRVAMWAALLARAVSLMTNVLEGLNLVSWLFQLGLLLKDFVLAAVFIQILVKLERLRPLHRTPLLYALRASAAVFMMGLILNAMPNFRINNFDVIMELLSQIGPLEEALPRFALLAGVTGISVVLGAITLLAAYFGLRTGLRFGFGVEDGVRLHEEASGTRQALPKMPPSRS